MGEPITKALLMINPSAHGLKSITFSEQFVCVFGGTGISRGRLQLELEDHRIRLRIDQRFLRVFAKRDGTWRAVSVAVTPITDAPN